MPQIYERQRQRISGEELHVDPAREALLEPLHIGRVGDVGVVIAFERELVAVEHLVHDRLKRSVPTLALDVRVEERLIDGNLAAVGWV